MIYLENVVICLGGQEYLGEAEQLAERVRAAGLESRVEAAEGQPAGGSSAGGNGIGESSAGRSSAGENGIAADGCYMAEGMAVDPGGEEAAALVVTDVPRIARRLVGEGCPVLAFLHEGNWEEDFSDCRYACEGLEELDAEYLDRVYRRYRGLPWDVLETERCLIRETTVEDVDAFYEIYREPSITKYMEGLYEDIEEERAYVRDYIDQVYSFYNFGMWTVVEKKAGEVIGRAGIGYREGYEDPEIGFLIAVPWQGKGYAMEVCGAIMRYVREELGFSRVLAFVRPENGASMHICRKLGVEIFEINS